MKGSETSILGYMDGSDKQFVIPVYQRNYDWQLENCKQLFDDLVKVVRLARKSHFFGSLVSAYDHESGFNTYLIIDGQQRLTTISLLLLAIYNLVKAGVVSSTSESLADKIYEVFLTNKYQKSDKRIRLKPVKGDRDAFNRLFGDVSEYVRDSNLTANYNYFYTRIQKEEVSVDALFEAIKKLEVINISLSPEDNPQLIFESLNSTGVALSEGDKIRNFILMGLTTREQEAFYTSYWNKIEVCTKYDVSLFVRDYLSVKTQRIPAMSKVYGTFKSYVEEEKFETEALLQELLSYARSYETLLVGKTVDQELNRCIGRLNHLETSVIRPFFLEVLRLHSKGELSLAEVKEMFLITEHYIFRRMICEIATNTLNKTFASLHREIMRYDGTSLNYLEKFKYALASKTEHRRFPNDKEFRDAFAVRPVYQMNSKNKVYILERFENYGTVEVQDVYRLCEDGVYSIEHIMPQTLTPAWREALGENYEDIHETWLHRIGNLTLTGYNAHYSNCTFLEKREMKSGFAESHLYLNRWVAQQEEWGVAQLEARTDILMSRALQMWPFPVSSFKPIEKMYDSCTLDDDVDVTGRDIVKFIYKNTEHPVESWTDMMTQVLRLLHSENKSVLSRLAYATEDANTLSAYVSAEANALRTSLLIDEHIYLEVNTSTMMKLALLRKFFKLYNVEEDDLVFCLKDVSDDEVEDLAPRHETRLQYWAYALPIIQAAHDDGTGKGPFLNNAPTTSNWSATQVGMNGFVITCVANQNRARVQLCLGNNVTARNKQVYDLLYVHKDEIESQLDVKLDWDRGDEMKASFITYNLQNVSIKNEEDWKQMAKFHAEWSKKFCDVFVPLLKQK